MFYSQWGQDEYIYNNFFKNKKNGYFLEIGADDGLRFSNCAFFEKELGWNGIAVEARKDAFNNLIKNRNCICLNKVLSDKIEETKFLELKGYGIGLSGIIDKYDERHINRINNEIKNPNHKSKEIITVKTEKLNDILDNYDVINIDFLSIDTEGSEIDILKTLDFNKYNINVITIEDNYNDIKLMNFFKDRNYKFVKQIECDKIFIKNK